MAKLTQDGLYKINAQTLNNLGVRMKLFTEAAADVVLDNLGPALVEQWKYLAGQRLNTSKERYLKGILPPKRKGRTLTIGLAGDFPRMVEEGVSAFDMRQTLLSGGMDKRVIAFRIKGPGQKFTVGKGTFLDGAGSPATRFETATPAGMPYQKRMGQSAGAAIGKQIWQDLRALPAPGSRGNRLRDASPDWVRQKYSIAANGRVKKLKTKAVSPSIYSGARREVSRRLNNRTNQRDVYRFTSYRTITRDVKAGDWVHPGIQKKDLLNEVLDDIPRIVDDILAGFTGEVFK